MTPPSKPTMTPIAEFHMYVGFCITAWAEVDEQLFQLCLKYLGTTQERAAIVYYRMSGLDVRLKLTDELFSSIVPKPERKDGGHPHPDRAPSASILKTSWEHGGALRIIRFHQSTKLALPK